MALVLSVLLVWTGLGFVSPATPSGTQCPTAAVQQISVAVKDCCGHTVGLTSRAPRPGDKAFVQCRCAEKRAAQQKATSEQSGFRLVMIGTSPLSIDLPSETALHYEHVRFDSRLAGIPSAPKTPPPLAAA